MPKLVDSFVPASGLAELGSRMSVQAQVWVQIPSTYQTGTCRVIDNGNFVYSVSRGDDNLSVICN